MAEELTGDKELHVGLMSSQGRKDKKEGKEGKKRRRTRRKNEVTAATSSPSKKLVNASTPKFTLM